MKLEVYVDTLQRQINAEKKAEIEQYQALIQQKSLKERRTEGLAWYPVSVLKVGFTLGNKIFVVLENPTPRRYSSFKSGQMVKFSCLHPNEQDATLTGTINYIVRDIKMKVILNTEDKPFWLEKEPLSIELMYDEKSYDEMNKALKKLVQEDSGKRRELLSVLLNKVSAQAEAHSIDLANLNPPQNSAVGQMLGNSVLSLVHGPPGTGKTTTLIEGIRLMAKTNKQILVTAPSNAAVDLLALRAYQKGLRVVRIGNISRVEEEVLELTLERQMAAHPDSKKIKKIKIEAAEARRMASKYKRNFDAQARAERKEMYQQARELMDWARQLEDRIVLEILSSAQVICTTLVGAASSVLEGFHFETVCIDEAAQSPEAACWIPMLKADRIVLAGDPYQLPPTVKSNEAKALGMEKTLLERLISEQKEVVTLLTIQYRMHDAIMAFSNQQFYGGQLRAHASVGAAVIAGDLFLPIEFIDTAGSGFEEKQATGNKSYYNLDEITILQEHLYQFSTQIREMTPPTVGIIAPYKEQVIRMEEIIQEDSRLSGLEISVNTIDGFQGQERDIIYISLVRSNENAVIGFLKEYRRMNVALTRARKKLVIIGDSATIGADAFYNNLLETVEQKGSYRTAWEFML